MLGSRITADFACVNEDFACPKLPPLLERFTKFHDGTFPENGNCAHCVSPYAAFVCGVCFSPYSATFYCNSDHQARDWVLHKLSCKSIPKLIRPEQAKAAIAQANDPKPKKKFTVPFVEHLKKGDSVVIVQVFNERVIYIRPTREDFSQLISLIKASAETSQNLTAKPEINDTVLAPYQEEFCRAHVVDVFEPDEDGNDLRCFLLDYGIFKEYKWANGLKKLSYKSRALPRQTFKVILNRSRTWVAAAVTIMNRSSASRVTVRSASMPPLSLSHWV